MAINERQARAQAAVAQRRECFPAIFTPANCRPLKIGIHNELVALGFDREMVVVGLRSYCGSSAYLSALREGASRIGLDGQPTAVVNAQEEKFAVAQLAEKIARAKNQRLSSAPQTPEPSLVVTVGTSVPAASGGPRRLSLNDLREAGRRRRA
jgi:ProP effector